MKSLTLLFYPALLLFVLFSTSISQAQEYTNPFEDHKNTFNQKDIIILYNETGTNQITQQVLGFDWVSFNAGQSDDLVVPFTEPTILGGTDLGNGSFLSVSSGRFNDDRRDDMVYILERDTEIKVGMNTLYTEFVDTDSSYIHELDEPQSYVSITIPAFSGAPRDAVGDFDGDGTDEIAIAWWQSDSNIVHIQILDSDNGETLENRAMIGDQSSIRVFAKNAFDLSCGDLNGDGADEIILTGLEENSSGNADLQVFVKVYEVNSDGSGMISPKAHLVLDDTHFGDYPQDNNYQLAYAQTAVTGLKTHADIPEDQSEDIFAAFAYVYSGDPIFEYDNYFQYVIRASEDLTTLNVVDSLVSYASTGVFKDNYPLEVNAGDLNGDQIEDVLLLTNGGKIFTVMNDSLMFKGNVGGIVLDENNSGVLETIDRMELGDVDRDERMEVITFSKGINQDDNEDNFFVNVYGVLDDFGIDTLGGAGYYFSDESNTNLRSYAIAVGNLDGHDLHFGEAEVYNCEYVQPIFIIGGIPSHFDIIDSVPYDVNDCYPEQDCELEVKITQSSSSSTTAQVEFNADWAVSSELDVSSTTTGGGDELNSGVTVGTTVSGRYGVKFNEVNTETNTQTLSISITASSDDMVQYLKIPVTLYQYPVMDAAGDTSCYVIAAFPANNFSPQTIVANGKSLFNYTPDHENGNILSYPPVQSGYDQYNDLPSTPGSWIILDEAKVPSYTMSPSGGINYTLTSASDLAWSESEEAYAAVNTGVSTGGFGIGLPENQDGTQYLEAQNMPTNLAPNAIDVKLLRMYSNSISEETEFSITPTNIIGAPNEFNYVISPKIYWNTDGSGIVKFEVDMDHETGSGSFWSIAYTDKPDPALNLPYRYDKVHNPDLTNTENLDRTKSIRFSSNIPQENDTVSLYLKTFNYSFVNTGEPVEFELYHEDPDEGGTPIEDINGNTLFETVSSMGVRGRIETEIRFIAGRDLITDDFAKIYVVLDPNNLIDEIHEDNNKGWVLFGYACNQPGNLIVTESQLTEISEVSYLNVFPNPAQGQMIIGHDLRSVQTDHPMVIITSVMGERVAQFHVVSDLVGKIYWNTNAVAPGLYIVYLVSDKGILESKKITVM
jgi:hypothetical protein